MTPPQWRAPTVDDAATWSRLRAAVEAVDRTGEVYGDRDVLDELQSPETDPATHARFAFDGATGDALAWGWITYATASTRHHRVFLDGAVHPAWRDRGLGTELVTWLVERGSAIARGFGDDLPAWVELRGDADDDARAALFRAHGFTPLRHFLELRRDLTRPIGAVALDPAYALTGYEHARDEALRHAHNEAFRDQWGSEERDRSSWAKWFTGSRHFRPDLTFLATVGDEIVAYALSAVYEDDAGARGYTSAWTTHLGVRRPWRGRGIARALLARSLTAFRDAGLQYGLLDVDGENPSGAVALYRSLGYETVRDVVSWWLPVASLIRRS